MPSAMLFFTDTFPIDELEIPKQLFDPNVFNAWMILFLNLLGSSVPLEGQPADPELRKYGDGGRRTAHFLTCKEPDYQQSLWSMISSGPFRLVAEEGKSKCSWVSLDDISNILMALKSQVRSSTRLQFSLLLQHYSGCMSQLINSLTSRTTADSELPPLQNLNPRSSILKWFSSLTVHQRQAHITAVDSRFVRVLVNMLGKVRTHGHGCFIVLPDIPSRDDLPNFCFKKSRGLPSRVAESNPSERLVSESVRLFSSTEGESVGQCSCSVRSLDTATVSEEFVEDLERFVETMDEVSNGGFLRGEESELGSDWVEL
ncbi:hypothetical protein SO802_022529 [Lithocarpus litseifolius]|uniref:Uncharacterized protein n=1 Tax=Lithocarpus litseifolius TaxID=425828 RepID=A0AAW2C3P7_9ROSI